MLIPHAWMLVAALDVATLGRPLSISGGEPAVECAWPTTVAVKTSGGLCTGSLVHPSVVVYAAHCGAADVEISLGQHADVPAIDAEVADCETNPEYLGASNPGQDWAYCRLARPVLAPITPPLFGCEVDAIVAGATVFIAGFGQDSPGMGAGPKRWAQTEIVSTFGATATIGGDGASTCAGDSGGSAFVRLDDGGWRAISMVSAGVNCTSAVHALMHPAVEWIEERSGVDITPCHDVDGTWAPGPECGGFYAGDPDAAATWADGCAGLVRSGAAQTCGAPYDDSDEADTDTDTATSEGSSTGAGDQTGGLTGGPTDATGEDGTGTTDIDDPSTTGGTDTEPQSNAPGGTDQGGCEVGLRRDRTAGFGMLSILGVILLGRRRDRARRC